MERRGYGLMRWVKEWALLWPVEGDGETRLWSYEVSKRVGTTVVSGSGWGDEAMVL